MPINLSTILGGLQSGTSVSASGTAVDFTGIPATAKQITVLVNGVSTNGSSNLQVQIGSGSPTTSGYSGYSVRFAAASNSYSALSGGFLLENANTATSAQTGQLVISLLSGNLWVCSGIVGSVAGANEGAVLFGSVTLAGTLDRVRLTTVNGTDTFDAGSINIIYQ
jgi:hypothetical protein